MKELVFKLPDGKPPFMGIRFEDHRKAHVLNQDLVLKHKDCKFSVTLEPIGDKINLKLYCEEPPIVRKYEGLYYNPMNFEEFVRRKDAKRTFGHVIRVYQYDVPVKLNSGQIFVLQVEELKVVYDAGLR